MQNINQIKPTDLYALAKKLEVNPSSEANLSQEEIQLLLGYLQQGNIALDDILAHFHINPANHPDKVKFSRFFYHHGYSYTNLDKSLLDVHILGVDVQNLIIYKFSRLLWKLAGEITNQAEFRNLTGGPTIEDIFQELRLQALIQISKYDPTQSSLSTFLTNFLTDRANTFMYTHQSPITIPSHTEGQLPRFWRTFADNRHRSHAEIISSLQEAGLIGDTSHRKQFNKFINLNAAIWLGRDTSNEWDHTVGTSEFLLHSQPDGSNLLEEQIISNELVEIFEELFEGETLLPKEKEYLKKRFGFTLDANGKLYSTTALNEEIGGNNLRKELEKTILAKIRSQASLYTRLLPYSLLNVNSLINSSRLPFLLNNRIGKIEFTDFEVELIRHIILSGNHYYTLAELQNKHWLARYKINKDTKGNALRELKIQLSALRTTYNWLLQPMELSLLPPSTLYTEGQLIAIYTEYFKTLLNKLGRAIAYLETKNLEG